MRVIGGQFGSRPLLTPDGRHTRPTSDRLRETLMNVLENGAVNRVRGANLLDLFAGTGAVGIEALSRGAQSVTFVEQDAKAMTLLEANCARLGLTREVHRVRASVASWLRRAAASATQAGSFDLVFLDPPWNDAEAYTQTLEELSAQAAHLLARDAWVIAEHSRKFSLAEQFGCLMRWRVLEQGDASLSFYQRTVGIAEE